MAKKKKNSSSRIGKREKIQIKTSTTRLQEYASNIYEDTSALFPLRHGRICRFFGDFISSTCIYIIFYVYTARYHRISRTCQGSSSRGPLCGVQWTGMSSRDATTPLQGDVGKSSYVKLSFFFLSFRANYDFPMGCQTLWQTSGTLLNSALTVLIQRSRCEVYYIRMWANTIFIQYKYRYIALGTSQVFMEIYSV